MVLSAVALDMWFYRSTVDVSRRGLTVVGEMFGFGSSRWIDASEIVKIATASKMNSEKLAYYDLVAVCRDGRRITLAKRMPGRRLADFVIRQIMQTMQKSSTGD
jgi:hypothetical protein